MHLNDLETWQLAVVIRNCGNLEQTHTLTSSLENHNQRESGSLFEMLNTTRNTKTRCRNFYPLIIRSGASAPTNVAFGPFPILSSAAPVLRAGGLAEAPPPRYFRYWPRTLTCADCVFWTCFTDQRCFKKFARRQFVKSTFSPLLLKLREAFSANLKRPSH